MLDIGWLRGICKPFGTRLVFVSDWKRYAQHFELSTNETTGIEELAPTLSREAENTILIRLLQAQTIVWRKVGVGLIIDPTWT
jgi:hypothetical protein